LAWVPDQSRISSLSASSVFGALSTCSTSSNTRWVSISWPTNTFIFQIQRCPLLLVVSMNENHRVLQNQNVRFIIKNRELSNKTKLCNKERRYYTLFFFYKNTLYKNVKAWIVKKNKNISEGFKSGLFLNLAYVLMNRYQGLSHLTVLKNKQKYNLK